MILLRKFIVIVMLFLLTGCAWADELEDAVFALSHKRNEHANIELQLTNTESREDSIDEKYDKQVEALEKQIEQLEQQIEQIEAQIDKLEAQRTRELSADIDRVDAAEQKVSDSEDEIDELEAKIQDVSEIDPDNIHGWHQNASCQVIAWELSRDVKTDKNIIIFTVLHNRRNNRLTKLTATETDAKTFRVAGAPQGLQVFVPEGWKFNADRRPGNRRFGRNGYYAAKIITPDSLAKSKLDGNTNVQGNVKTFTTGEAFIVLRQSALTIQPPDDFLTTENDDEGE